MMHTPFTCVRAHGTMWRMRERSTIRRAGAAVAVITLATILSLYVYVQRFFTRNTSGKLVIGYQCTPDGVALQEQKINPNKMLFISCGGFYQ